MYGFQDTQTIERQEINQATALSFVSTVFKSVIFAHVQTIGLQLLHNPKNSRSFCITIMHCTNVAL